MAFLDKVRKCLLYLILDDKNILMFKIHTHYHVSIITYQYLCLYKNSHLLSPNTFNIFILYSIVIMVFYK